MRGLQESSAGVRSLTTNIEFLRRSYVAAELQHVEAIYAVITNSRWNEHLGAIFVSTVQLLVITDCEFLFP